MKESAAAGSSVSVDRDFVVAEVDRRLCGSFVEHLGRVVYTGIYDPGHADADALGLREDVAELVRELGVTVVRYPGGNFVSAYDWRDGIGPPDSRPRRLDPAWRTLETNAFGLDEFMTWCSKVGTEPFLVFNLGTLGVEAACQMVEYCNAGGSSSLAELRKANGRAAPYGVRLWGLGNEMDGDWQIGSRSAAEYGSLASQVARAVKRVDEGAEVVAAGSSLRSMGSFPEWDRTVLEHCYDAVDYLALHQYYPADVYDAQSFAASGADFERYISAAMATCDYVQEVKRSKRRMNLAVDEWNVNYRGEPDDYEAWQEAPRIAEFRYNRADAVVVGSLLVPLLRHADRVKVACQSLLVNVGGPIRTEPGQGRAAKEPIYEPLAEVFRLVVGASSLGVAIECPEVATVAYGDVPSLDAAAILDAEGASVTVFVVNRSVSQAQEVEVNLHGWGQVTAASGRVIAADQGRRDGALEYAEVALPGGVRATTKLPPFSWAVLELGVR